MPAGEPASTLMLLSDYSQNSLYMTHIQFYKFTCTCMDVRYMYLHLRVCMYGTCVYVYACTYLRLRVCMYGTCVYVYACTYLRLRVCMYGTCVYVYECTVHACTCMRVRRRMYHTSIHIHTRRHHTYSRMYRTCIHVDARTTVWYMRLRVPYVHTRRRTYHSMVHASTCMHVRYMRVYTCMYGCTVHACMCISVLPRGLRHQGALRLTNVLPIARYVFNSVRYALALFFRSSSTRCLRRAFDLTTQQLVLY